MKAETRQAPFPGRALAALLAAACLASCGGAGDPRYFHTYMQSDPGKLDPFYSADVVSGRVLTMLCNGLFSVGYDGKLAGDLAESYSFDGRKLAVKLKRGVLFHDGKELTAGDVIFSLERIRLSSNPTSPRKWMFSTVKGMRQTDRYGLVIELSRAHATFPYLLTMPGSYIVSPGSDFARGRVIGTGPFYLAEWRQDERLLLLRHDGYFGEKARVAGVEFRIIPEDLTARFEFVNGTLDYFEMPYLTRLGFDEKSARMFDLPELSVHYIAINTKRAPFGDRQFRRALNRAVDRRAIMSALFSAKFAESRGPVPPGTDGYTAVPAEETYDPAWSREAIARLGLTGRRVTLIIKADHQVALIAQMVQHFLEAAGLRVTLVPLEWSAMKSRTLRGDFDLAYFTWHADYPEAENFLYPLFHSANVGAGGNRSFFGDARVDRLLDGARAEVDRQKRFDSYRRAEGIIRDEAPWLFLWFGGKRIALSGRVGGFRPYPVFTVFKGNEITLDGGR